MFGTPIDVPGIYSYRDNLQISHAVKTGNTIYISGQVAVDPEGNVVGEGDPEAQAENISRNIYKVLQEAGSAFDEKVKIILFSAACWPFEVTTTACGIVTTLTD